MPRKKLQPVKRPVACNFTKNELIHKYFSNILIVDLPGFF